MAREKFAFVRHGESHTDPIVIGDHVEDIDGKLVVLDEDRKEVYSVSATKGRFIQIPLSAH